MSDPNNHSETGDGREHGQTYSEAVDEALEESAEKVRELREDAETLREERKYIRAKIVEWAANDLEKDALELAEKRRKMPFGLDSAQGIGEVLENPTISHLEETQRGDSDE